VSQIGSLGEFGVAHVLRLLAHSKKTGRLSVTSAGEACVCDFRDGQLIHASNHAYRGDEAVIELFGWQDGQVEFNQLGAPGPRNVTRSLETLIELGESHGSWLRQRRGQLNDEQLVLQWASEPPSDARMSLGARDWQVLRLVDGIRTLAEVRRASHHSRWDVLRTLYEFEGAGFLERVDTVKAVTAERYPPFAGFSIVAPTTQRDGLVELDEGLRKEWMKVGRFSRGVERIRVGSNRGRNLNYWASFRPGLGATALLPEGAFLRLAISEGERVYVRPIGSRIRGPRV